MTNYLGLVLRPNYARRFLEAVSPLLFSSATSSQLRNQVLLILRKALFSRDSVPRLIAAVGFGALFRLSTAPSACLPPAQSALPSELLSFIGRCLTQQSDVKELLYEELANAPCSGHSSAVGELLLQHLMHKYCFDAHIDAGSHEGSLAIHACVDRRREHVPIVEPLHSLISTLSKLSDPHSPDNEIAAALAKLMQRVSKAELEEFELDKSSPFNFSSVGGLVSIRSAAVLLPVLESLAEAALFQYAANEKEDRLLWIQGLFKLFFDLRQLLKEKLTVAKKEKRGAAAAIAREDVADEPGEQAMDAASVADSDVPAAATTKNSSNFNCASGLSRNGVELFLKTVLSDSPPSWGNIAPIRQHVLCRAIELLKSAQKSLPDASVESELAAADCGSAEAPPPVAFSKDVMPMLWSCFANGWQAIKEVSTGKVGRALASLALEAVLEAVAAFVNWTASQPNRAQSVTEFFKFASKEASEKAVHSFMNQVWMIIPPAMEQGCSHEAELLLQLLSMLHPLLPDELLEDHITSATAFTMLEGVSPLLSRKAMRLFWSMQLRSDESMECLSQFAAEIRTLWGTNTAGSTDVQPGAPDFVVVSAKTAPALFTELLDILEAEIEAINSILRWMKQRRGLISRPPRNKAGDAEDDDSSDDAAPLSSISLLQRVCIKSLGVGNCLQVMLTTAVASSGVTRLFKCVLSFYRTLSSVAKEVRFSSLFRAL